MDVLLDAAQIDKAMQQLVAAVAADHANAAELVVIGVRSRGEVLAQRLARGLGEVLDRRIPAGTLDITLYRDDLNDPRGNRQPTVRSTEIEFDVNGKLILLVDDVLHTGRSVRAAMDALVDLGRPKAVRLAVLVDRGGREFPIQADYVGCKVDVAESLSVIVELAETDGAEQVILE